jgi:hypothetical protein
VGELGGNAWSGAGGVVGLNSVVARQRSGTEEEEGGGGGGARDCCEISKTLGTSL